MGTAIRPRVVAWFISITVIGWGDVSIALEQPSAEEGGGEAAGTGLAEVIVTARKVSENLQSVPISVTALSAQDLEQRNLTQASEIGQFTPSTFIEVPAGGNATSAKVTIRGQLQADNLITLDPSVGWYLDDVYLARAYATNVSLFDLARVEALKGPQGTLYGRNTTGGAIKLFSVKADPKQDVSGFVTGGWANYNNPTVGGAVNLPVVADKFALRVAAQLDDRRDGYGRVNFVNGSPALNPSGPTGGSAVTGTHDNWMTRVNGTWLVNDAATLWFGYEHDTMDLTYTAYNLFGDSYIGPLFFGLPVGLTTPSSYTRSSSDYYTASLSSGLPRSSAKANTANVTGQYQINEQLSTRLVLGWRQLKSTYNSDIDGTDASLADFLYPLAQDATQWSAEWQLGAERLINGKLALLTGLFYFQEKGSDISNADGLFSFSPTLGPLNDLTDSVADKNKSRSGFVHGTFHLTDSLDATAGIRYTKDTKPLLNHQTLNSLPSNTQLPFPTGCRLAPDSPGFDAATCTSFKSNDFGFVSWNAGLDWKLNPDVMVYLKGASASRSGGQNERAQGAATAKPFNPEKATDVEIGVKSQFWDHRLRLNADYYHTFYNNVQQTQLLQTETGLVTVVYNAGKAHIDGVEVELAARLTEQLTLSQTASYFNGMFTDHNVEVGAVIGTPTFNSAPKWQTATEVQYRQPVSFGAWAATLNYTWRHHYLMNNYTQEEVSALPTIDTTVPSLGLLGARLTLELQRWDTDVAVWGKNLADKHYYTSPLSIIPGVVTLVTPGEPRTYGLTVTKRF